MGFNLGLGLTVATLALLVVVDSLVEVFVAKVGPQQVGEIELGIGCLPEQEVADTQFAAGTDEEVGVGIVAGGEVATQCLLVDIALFQSLAADLLQCLGYLPA